MVIQWFPGHMYKAKKAIQTRMKSIDLVIEVLDARLPASCISPLLNELSQHKAKLKILNKADLADAEITKQWLAYFRRQDETGAIAIVSNQTNKNQQILEMCKNLRPNRHGLDKPLRMMICGVPNVGKSSLINNLIGKKIAKTGNEAGITKQEQRLLLADDIWLYDTPGMLWEKIIVAQSGYYLAAAGSVGKNAYDDQEVALHLIDYLKQYYLANLCQRYSIETTAELTDLTDDSWIELIAKKRGAILPGAKIDYQKVAEIIIQDFRDGRLGRVTLERPAEWETWYASALAFENEKKLLNQQKKRAKIKNEVNLADYDE